MHPSIANLSSRLHLCAGDVPPPLVGASATLVEHAHNGAPSTAHVYLFGGRLVSSRRMVNSLYRLDLDHMKWSKLTPTTKTPSADASSNQSAHPLPAQPQPRYFHSADLWNDKIIFFGGMGYSQRPSQDANGANAAAPAEELCVLDELLAFDLTTQQWDYSFDVVSRHFDRQSSDPQHDSLRPAPRYAHLSSLSGDTLSIVGGQNLANQYVESINLFSLSRNQWFGAQRFRKQCGSYRSLAVGAKSLYKHGEKAKCYPRAKDPLSTADANGAQQSTASPSTSNAPAPAANGNESPNKPAKVEQNPLPMSYAPAAGEPLPVYLYSNYNFTDVRRELEVLTLRADADANAAVSDADKAQRSRSASNASQDSALDVDGPLTPSQASAPASSGPFVSMQDRSNHMGGVTLPPGLRFPTGALLGPYLLISGTYLANATQSFSIWALHLPTMVWSRIESGSALSTGSWNRALLWPAKNRLVVVGHKERDLVSDYNHRQTNWDHVVVLELEAWGIYQPPASPLSEAAVQLGLDKLAATAPSAMASAHALARGVGAAIKPNASDATSPTAADAAETPETGVEHELESLSLGGRGDFEIVCSDGLRIGCDRALLEARWPWFRSKMDEFRRKARRTLRIAYPASTEQFGLGIIPEDIADFLAEEDEDDEPIDPLVAPSANKGGTKHRIKDPRFQPRHLQISEPSPVVLALLQYVYTLRIGTALQRHPAVVCALMVLARTYNMDELAVWARHAAHVALADDLNPKTSGSARAADALSPSSSMTHAMDASESGGLDLFRPAESLGLHPEERHRLAVCLYEAASLCGCEGLQIRALRVVMAIARWLQKHGAGPNGNGGGGAGLEKHAQGRSDGTSRDRSGSSSHHHASGSNGAGAAHSSSGTFRAGGSSNYRNGIGGGSLSTGASPMLQMPSPVPSMSRAGSDTASSHGPLTPNSVYQSFLDRRGDSFSSSNDAPMPGSGSALAYLNEVESLDDNEGRDYRKLSSAQEFGSSSRLDKIAETSTSSPTIVAPHEAGATDSSAGGGSTRKRFSLFGRGMASSTAAQVAEPAAAATELEVPRSESSLGDVTMQAGSGLLDRRASSSATSSPLLASEEWSSRFRLPRHSMSSRGDATGVTSAASSGLNSPALTMDPKRRHLQTSAASSPASEQFPVNSYGPRSEQDQASRSASQHSLSTEASAATSTTTNGGGLQRSGSSASVHPPTPLAGIELAQDVSHLSAKEIAKLQREERKRQEKEEKQRKKAEKAEYKRLAAEAVFGPKGSAGPSPALASSDFAMYTAGTAGAAGGAGGAGASSSRRSSEPSDSQSGTSTASPRTGSSLRTAYSPRSPATTAPAKRGEWSVTTATTASPWFSAPPPMMSAPGLKGMPRSNRSTNSLSGRSSGKTRLTS